jgi:hypothetical protein
MRVMCIKKMISSDKRVWFEDATPYIRDNKLNELGIDKQLNKIGI